MRFVKLALLDVLGRGPMMWDGTSVSEDIPCDVLDWSKPYLQGEDRLQIGPGVVICMRCGVGKTAKARVMCSRVFAAIFSTICIKAYVTVVSGNRSLPRWVQGVE